MNTTLEQITLFVADTAETMLATFLDIAKLVKLPVSTWRDGDPTLTLAKWAARVMAAREADTAAMAKSASLSTVDDDAWADLIALDTYGVTRVEAAPSTPTLTLRNDGGGQFTVNAGELIAKCSLTGVTFHSTSGFELLHIGDTADVTLRSDVDGTIASVGVNEVDTIVTPSNLDGVVIAGSTAAAGSDQQSLDSLTTQCASTLGALSPNGPADAYESVVRDPARTGTTEITRAKTDPNSAGLLVSVYIASASGAPSAGAVTAAQAAIDQWAEPLGFTATAIAATAETVAVTLVVTGDALPSDFDTQIEQELATLFAAFDIADGDSITVAPSRIITAAQKIVPLASIACSAPAAPLTMALGHVPTLGTTSVTAA